MKKYNYDMGNQYIEKIGLFWGTKREITVTVVANFHT